MKVRTMRGKELDLGAIIAQNETEVAVGNAKMNARGDLLGPGGEIIKRKEQVAKEYHSQNPNAVKRVSLKGLEPDVFMTPADAVADIKQQSTKKRTIVDSDK